MALNNSDYLYSLGLGHLVPVLGEVLTKASVIITAIDTSNGDRLPDDTTVSEAYTIVFRLGSILNQSLSLVLEGLIEANELHRSHNLMKEFNIFYQAMFAGYIKPLNQIIAFHENRL